MMVIVAALARPSLLGIKAPVMAAAAEQPDKALLGDWRFDEGGGDVARDSSGHGNDGEIRGATWVKGKFGTALHFGGRDAYVTIPGIASMDGSPELTAEAWVYWEKGGRYPNIITGGTWCPGGFLFFVGDNACSFRLGKPGKAPQVGQDWAETGASLVQFTSGQWYHLAATFKRPRVQTYLNGKAAGTAAWDYPIGFSGDLQIGTWGNPQTCHSGLIDEVKLYNRALTPEEVFADFQRTAAGRGPAGAGAPAYEKIPPKAAVPAVTLENDLTRLSLDARGRVIGLVDKATGKNRCAPAPADFATIKKNGVTFRPSACTNDGGRITFAFGKSGITAQVKVSVKQRYFVFELAAVSDSAVDEAVLGGLAVDLAKEMSASVAWASDGEFAAAVVPLNLQVEVGMSGGAYPAFSPTCVRRYGLPGAKIALAGCPTREVRKVLQEIVRAEGLPWSPLGGPFALDAEENRGSYLFATVSESNVDEWIELARRGGFAEVHLCPWWHRLGHYEPHPGLYPHGLAGLKQVTDKLHAAGLKVGMHTLTGGIQVDDPWVSPVPDKRLAKDAKFTLAAAVGADDKVIPTVERPEGLETFWSDMSTGNTLQIGDEIVAYTGLSQEPPDNSRQPACGDSALIPARCGSTALAAARPPYGFTGCTRGQWGTKRSAHARGATVQHLVATYCTYIPDEDSTLVDELADCIAKAFNTCRCDMIYQDGSEGMRTAHAVAKMKRAIFTKLQGRVLVESSSGSWGAWPFHSRVGAWDHPVYGFNRFTDLHCAELQRYSASELLPGHMGWWVITGPSADHAGMFPEDMEYFCGKCLGWDWSMSLQGVAAGQTPPNARQNEYLTMLGRYERLRLDRYFSEDVKARLRTPKEQFRLAQDDKGHWQFKPTDYLPHKVTSLADGTNAWTVNNRYAAQLAKLRVEALYACQPYAAPEGVLVTDFAKPEDFSARAAATGVTLGLATSAEQVKAGTVSASFTAKNATATRRGAWAKAGRVFTPPLDMSKCGALGVWIHGDGKGELLNFQLNNTREYYTVWDDHYVDVNFTGWRYYELLLRERDAQRHQDYVWPYGGACEVGRSPILRNRVGSLSIYYNDLPPNEQVRCFLGPVKALPVVKVKLSNPTVVIGGQRLVFPVTLESGQFIEYEGPADCRWHDERGAILQRIAPQGCEPKLASGDNPVSFTCDGPAGYSARAQVTVITQGPPLGGPAPGKTPD
jgi:hypothetical protein